jgi:hypothetical protein
MKSCADSSINLVRRGEGKVHYLTVRLALMLNDTQAVRRTGLGRGELPLPPMHLCLVTVLWGITSALRSIPLNTILVMLCRQTRTSCKGIPDKAGAIKQLTATLMIH